MPVPSIGDMVIIERESGPNPAVVTAVIIVGPPGPGDDTPGSIPVDPIAAFEMVPDGTRHVAFIEWGDGIPEDPLDPPPVDYWHERP